MGRQSVARVELAHLAGRVRATREEGQELMNGEPRLLVWNYTSEEKEKLDIVLKGIGAPAAVTLERTQGCLPLREVIHNNAHGENPFTSDEKVILFYNIPQQGVFFLINTFKEQNLPKPIYAVVTEHSIEWRFSDLLEHLVEEREKVERRNAGKSGQ